MFIAYTLVVLAPAGLVLGWVLIRGMKREPTSVRNRASLVSFSLVTFAGLMWAPVAAYASRTDWKTGVGLGKHIRNVEAWAALAVVACGLGLLLSFFGKPRLIPLVAIASVGISFFWLSSTAP